MAVGVYLSGCKGVVSSVLDLEELASIAEGEVSVIRAFDDLFDPEVQERIVRDVLDAELDGVVLAGHSMDHYTRSLSGRLLHERLIEAGINPSRLSTVALAEQVAAPHADDPAGALTKAQAMLRVGLSRATTLDPLPSVSMVARQAVLVLGATVEGIVAAQRLLQLGYRVVLADRNDGLDRVRESNVLSATMAFVEGHENAETLSHATIEDGQGWVGDFEMALAADGDVMTVHAGGILLAEPDDPGWVEELRRHFKVDVDAEGRARSINPSTHPAETVEPGLMVVPAAGEEREVRDKVAAADSAAMALALALSRPETTHYVQTSSVDETLCGACASCVKTCAFGACYIDEDGVSHVDPRRCRACGKCVVSCPVGARDIISSPHEFMVGAIEELASAEVEGPKILGFVCGGCGNPAMNAASRLSKRDRSYAASFLPLWIPCSGRLDAIYVLEAFQKGFDGVTVFRCREGHCHNLIGNLDMDRRVNLLRTVLRSRGIDDARLAIVDVSPDEGDYFVETVNRFVEQLATVGSTEEVSA